MKETLLPVSKLAYSTIDSDTLKTTVDFRAHFYSFNVYVLDSHAVSLI